MTCHANIADFNCSGLARLKLPYVHAQSPTTETTPIADGLL